MRAPLTFALLALAILPARAAEAPGGRLAEGIAIDVKEFRFRGNRVIASARLEEALAAFRGRRLATEDLESLRRRLSDVYLAEGYVASGATIPDQEVEDGILHIDIVEGRLTDIQVTGDTRYRQSFLADRLHPQADQPPRLADLQQRMQLLLQNPQIARIDAALLPGAAAGEATLRLQVVEHPHFTVGAEFGNTRSPAVGGHRFETSLAARNLSGYGETTALRLGDTRGGGDGALRFALPVAADDSSLMLRTERDRATIVEAPFNRLDISGRTETRELAFLHPLERHPGGERSLSVGLLWRDSRTYLLGSPFSFTAGAQDGRSASTSLRLAYEWLQRGTDSAISGRLGLASGFLGFGATRNTDGSPDSRFQLLHGQLNWAGRDPDGENLLRATVQLANRPLLATEKFALGGADTLRGYLENLALGDNGVVVGAERRWPLGAADAAATIRAKFAAFVDWGRTWNARRPEPTELASLGIGLIVETVWGLSAQWFLGEPLRRPDFGGRWRAKDGHFRLAFQRSF